MQLILVTWLTQMNLLTLTVCTCFTRIKAILLMEKFLRHRILPNDYFSIVAPTCVFDLAICNSITKVAWIRKVDQGTTLQSRWSRNDERLLKQHKCM